MRLSRRLLSAIFATLLVPAAAHAFDGGAWTVSPGEWYTEFSATRAYAASQFFPDARNGAIDFEGRFQQFDAVSYSELGWRKNTSFMLGVPFTSQTLRFEDQTYAVSGLSDFLIGVRHRLKDDQPAFVFEAAWHAPSGYNKNLYPSLGDGRQKFSGSLHIGLPLPVISGYVQAARGLHFVTEDGNLFWTTRAEAGKWIGNRVLLGLRYNDAAALSVTREIGLALQGHRAGASATVRIDDRMDVSAGCDRVFYGRNALETTQFHVTLGFKQTKLNAFQGHLGGSRKP